MVKNMNSNIKDMLDAFENDKDFKAIKQKYEAPNEFTIMGTKRREEWHSSFINWLLNPKQNHKLGVFPLEKLLDIVNSKNKGFSFDAKDIDDIDFDTEHKTSDGRFIDIMGISKSLILVIENKIKAKETFRNSIPQSDAYYDFCEKEYEDKKRCYILLKAFRNCSVANKNFIPITYQELFDKVIEPSYEKCKELQIEDTKRVLEQYALDISNPFNSISLANTQKKRSCAIYKKHKEIIELIREAMGKFDKDNDSVICKFFVKNKDYINNVILPCAGKSIITLPEENLRGLNGTELVNMLIDYKYIIPDYTELLYKKLNATCIIMIDENHKFYTGYCRGEYKGTQEVEILASGFERLRDAELAVEKAVGSQSTNGGKNVGEIKLLHSGVEEAEGKKIGDIFKSLQF